MEFRIEQLEEKKLVGQKLTMNLVQNKTVDLWRNFMPKRDEIKNKVNTDFISMQVYDEKYFKPFSPTTLFEKWATVEVVDFTMIPDGMEPFLLGGGLYVVFSYKGDENKAAEAFNYIFMEWFPKSGYVLDSRPHFELLGEKYHRLSPDSEEEIWIPIKRI